VERDKFSMRRDRFTKPDYVEFVVAAIWCLVAIVTLVLRHDLLVVGLSLVCAGYSIQYPIVRRRAYNAGVVGGRLEEIGRLGDRIDEAYLSRKRFDLHDWATTEMLDLGIVEPWLIPRDE
jgi:hypothetical protein